MFPICLFMLAILPFFISKSFFIKIFDKKSFSLVKFIITFFLVFSISAISQENKIDSIKFIGNKRMDKTFLYHQIKCQTNNVLDSNAIKKDITILNRLNGISNAQFTTTKNANSSFTITYIIKENFSLIPIASVWTTNDVAAYRIGLYEYNLLGKNNTIGAFYQNNFFSSFGFNFASPQFFSSKFGLGFNFQNLSTKEPIFFKNATSTYKYTNTSAELFSNYQINFFNQITFGFTIFNEKYDYISGFTDAFIPTNVNKDKRLLKLQYDYNNLKYNYFLLDGLKVNTYFQYVLTKNNYQEKFAIAWTDFLFYKQIGSNANWASRLRLGLATNNNSPFAPFSVDNNLNIRGVGNIIDRGTGIIVLNTEYRKTILQKDWFVLQGNAFVDSGTWRNPGGNFSDFGDKTNLRIYPGVGLRFIHKTIYNAVFRLDYGYGITKNASNGIVFGVGQYF
jgi:hypothetical protein